MRLLVLKSIALCTNDVMKFQILSTPKGKFVNNKKQLLQYLTVLTEDDDLPGSKFERDPQEYIVNKLKRWLKCWA